MKIKAQSTTEWVLIIAFVIVITGSYFAIINIQKHQTAIDLGIKKSAIASKDAKKEITSSSNSNVETAGALGEILELQLTQEQINSKLSGLTQSDIFESGAGQRKSMAENAITLNKYLNLGFKDVDSTNIDVDTIVGIFLAADKKVSGGAYDSQPGILTMYQELKRQIKSFLE